MIYKHHGNENSWVYILSYYGLYEKFLFIFSELNFFAKVVTIIADHFIFIIFR